MKNGPLFWIIQALAGVGIAVLGTAMTVLLFVVFILFIIMAALWALGCVGWIAGLVAIGRIRIDEAQEILEELAQSEEERAKVQQ